MDPAALSFAVIGLFITCCKGYRILSDAHRAPAHAQNAARRLRIEFYTLEAWGESWGIRHSAQQGQGDDKFRLYLMRPRVRDGVFDALCLISETLTDIGILKKKYGIVFDYNAQVDKSPRIPREIRDFLDGQETPRGLSTGGSERSDSSMEKELNHYQNRMSLLERCRWSLRDKNSMHELIETLRRHNEDLLRLCSWEALGQINRGLANLALPQSKNFMELYLMADSAEEAAKDKMSPVAEGRERIARLARFKAKVMTPTMVSNRYRPRWPLLDEKDYIHFSRLGYTFGESQQTHNPVFIEWQSYRDHDGLPSESAKDQIHELGEFLAVSDRPHDLRTLECIGLFRDQANDRYGVVYNLPEHVRNVPLQVRNPETLTQLIRSARPMFDLDVRFDLAKRLLASVVAVHTCGWLHKNIRSDNIFFFVERGENYRKDIKRPFLVGWGLARPDDVVDDVTGEQAEYEPISRNVADGKKKKNNTSRNIWKKRKKNVKRDTDSEEDDSKTDDDEMIAKFNMYRHPDKVAEPTRRFRHSYDIYSLGLVLVEIGLWMDLRSTISRYINGYTDAHGLRDLVLSALVPRLWAQCGSIYGGVVKDCLTMESGDMEVAEEGQRNLAWGLAERLDQCVA